MSADTRIGSGIVGLALVVVVRFSAAATFNVPGDFPTIQAAVDAAVVGDSVIVAAGEWGDMETRTIVLNGVAQPVRACIFGKSGVSIIGAGASSTIVQGESGVPQGHVVVLPDGQFQEAFRVVGLALRGAGEFYRGVYAGPTWDVEILSCTIEHCAIGVRLRSGRLEMRECLVRNLSVTQSARMVESVDSATWVIEDCVFRDNVFLNEPGHLLFKDSVVSSVCSIRRCRFEGTRNGRVIFMGNQSLSLEDCWFQDNQWVGVQQGSCVSAVGGTGVIAGNTLVSNSVSGFAGGIVSLQLGSISFIGNTVHGTTVGEGSLAAGVLVDGGSPAFGANILSGNHGGPAFYRHDRAENPTDGCNVFWDNPGGHFENYDPQPTDVAVDPRYCDADNLDLTLRSDSPCLPGGISGCGQIGAWDEGCGTVGVIAESWARIKTLYRAED